MTEERKKEILKTIEERISSIPEKYVSKVIADCFFCSGEEDLIEVAKNIKKMQNDNFKKKSLYDKLMIALEKVCSDTHRGSILGWPAENFAWVENI